METNKITGQERPEQTQQIQSAAIPTPGQSEQVIPEQVQSETIPEQPEPGLHPIPAQPEPYPIPPQPYNPDELARIVSVIRQTTEPEQIILFGSLAGATPFSDITAYDLFVLTNNRPAGDWNRLLEYFRFKVPTRSRAITFINFYLCSSSEADGKMGAFYRFVRSEGEVVYSRKKVKREPCNYEQLYFAALDRYELYFNQAEEFLEAAEQSAGVCEWRQTAFQTAYAAELLLHSLYAAYHAAYLDLHVLTTLLQRTRTLSAELFILLDPERSCGSRMLSRLDSFRAAAPYRLHCKPKQEEIEEYLDRTQKMKGVIEKVCTTRLELYKSRIPTEE